MTDCLFVYGTLMRAAADATMGREMRARLEVSGTWLGPARLRGRLYDLGAYPGLVETADAGAWVFGEVFRLADPGTTFTWLDAYEGIDPRRSDNEYERVVRCVALASGRSCEAFVYLYRRDTGAAHLIESGRWQAS